MYPCGCVLNDNGTMLVFGALGRVSTRNPEPLIVKDLL